MAVLPSRPSRLLRTYQSAPEHAARLLSGPRQDRSSWSRQGTLYCTKDAGPAASCVATWHYEADQVYLPVGCPGTQHKGWHPLTAQGPHLEQMQGQGGDDITGPLASRRESPERERWGRVTPCMGSSLGATRFPGERHKELLGADYSPDHLQVSLPQDRGCRREDQAFQTRKMNLERERYWFSPFSSQLVLCKPSFITNERDKQAWVAQSGPAQLPEEDRGTRLTWLTALQGFSFLKAFEGGLQTPHGACGGLGGGSVKPL